jgi:tyrosyl-tRNA synthetase
MSVSEPDSKIDLLDSPEVVEKKLRKAVCVPKEVEGNGVIAFVEHVIMRAIALKVDRESNFVVQRKDQEPLVYETAAKLKEDYAADIVSPPSTTRLQY